MSINIKKNQISKKTGIHRQIGLIMFLNRFFFSGLEVTYKRKNNASNSSMIKGMKDMTIPISKKPITMPSNGCETGEVTMS